MRVIFFNYWAKKEAKEKRTEIIGLLPSVTASLQRKDTADNKHNTGHLLKMFEGASFL